MMTRQDIIDEARLWLGTPYRHQASMRGVGCDCLGLLRGVYRGVNGLQADPEETPPYRRDWYERTDRDMLMEVGRKYFDEVGNRFSDALPGDILVFRMRHWASAKHCAIMTGDDTMVHAYERHSVIEVNMGDWWKTKVVGVFRFKDLEG